MKLSLFIVSYVVHTVEVTTVFMAMVMVLVIAIFMVMTTLITTRRE